MLWMDRQGTELVWSGCLGRGTNGVWRSVSLGLGEGRLDEIRCLLMGVAVPCLSAFEMVRRGGSRVRRSWAMLGEFEAMEGRTVRAFGLTWFYS